MRRHLHSRRHTALCLSGGGIRSACFALGVLQGLARYNLLDRIDYLSTVSGGGYIGSWFSAWRYHYDEALRPAARGGTTGSDTRPISEQLAGSSSDGAAEPEPVSRVREYSYYLDPKRGLLSVDVWTLVATVLRNLLLNWAVLLPMIAAVVVVPRLYLSGLEIGSLFTFPSNEVEPWPFRILLVSFLLLAWSGLYVVTDLPSVGNANRSAHAFVMSCFAPICVAAGLLAVYWAWARNVGAPLPPLWVTVLISAVSHLLVWLPSCFIGRARRGWTCVAAVVSGVIAGSALWWLAVHVFTYPFDHEQLYAIVAFPMVLAVLCAAGAVFIAIANSQFEDTDREWWARLQAYVLLAMVLWLVVGGLVIAGPPALAAGAVAFKQRFRLSDASVQTAVRVLQGLLGIITAAAGAAAARAGRSQGAMTAVRRRILAVAAPMFVGLLILLIAWVNLGILLRLAPPTSGRPEDIGFWWVLSLALVFGAVGAIMGCFVPVNRFSLHGMYRNRLIRTFLGASRPERERRPNQFTNFDVDDNIDMHKLALLGRPLHVINMTINLVGGQKLAWQERKAESFTVTPLHAGSWRLGYRPSTEYGGGVSLGTAMTISGAAASPNMGYQSSPSLTFLLTMFNARLGAWLGNPGDAGARAWRYKEPWIGPGPLLSELFGRTSDVTPFVYLSDGGHFENLGVYEMVLRRCRVIVVSDAGCDDAYTFQDLSNAIRKIRIDLGIPIAIGADREITKASEGNGNPHFVLGTIGYDAVDPGAEPGTLVYIKATLSGDEPMDVRNYKQTHADFPHESTVDQWFGESQFESYRILGLHSVLSLCERWDRNEEWDGLLRAVKNAAEPSRVVTSQAAV